MMKVSEEHVDAEADEVNIAPLDLPYWLQKKFGCCFTSYQQKLRRNLNEQTVVF